MAKEINTIGVLTSGGDAHFFNILFQQFSHFFLSKNSKSCSMSSLFAFTE